MSASPPDKTDLEAGAQSPDADQMEQGESSNQPQLFDFEVKEQDRWLPIANGMTLLWLFQLNFSIFLSLSSLFIRSVSEQACPASTNKNQKRNKCLRSVSGVNA